MIRKEKYNEELIRTYSDAGYKIRKVGTDEIYDDAIDWANLEIEYEETDQKIESEEINAEYVEAAKILLGEEVK